MSIQGRWIQVQAYKHNEKLHRSWSHGYVLTDTNDFFVLVSYRARVTEMDGRVWHTKEPAIFILSKKDWYNVICMFKDKDNIHYYVNIASPAVYDNNRIKFIDYDLDVKLYPDGETKLLDEKEYEKHASEQEYGQDIQKIIADSVENVYRKIKGKEFPFDNDVIKGYLEEFELTVK